jgi:hypothetical protein
MNPGPWREPERSRPGARLDNEAPVGPCRPVTRIIGRLLPIPAHGIGGLDSFAFSPAVPVGTFAGALPTVT